MIPPLEQPFSIEDVQFNSLHLIDNDTLLVYRRRSQSLRQRSRGIGIGFEGLETWW